MIRYEREFNNFSEEMLMKGFSITGYTSISVIVLIVLHFSEYIGKLRLNYLKKKQVFNL